MLPWKKWKGGPREEYETQYFGFGAQALQIAAQRMIEENIKSSIHDMGTSLQNTLDLNEVDKAVISESCNALISLYCENSKVFLDIIDKEIDKTIKIPNNTLLSEDESQKLQLGDEEYENLVSDVSSLHSRLKRAALMETLLVGQMEEVHAAEPSCRMAANTMKLFDSLADDLQTHNPVLKSIVSDTQFLTAHVLSKDNLNLTDNIL